MPTCYKEKMRTYSRFHIISAVLRFLSFFWFRIPFFSISVNGIWKNSFSPVNFQFLSIFGLVATFLQFETSYIGTSGKNSIGWRNKNSAPIKSVDFIGGQIWPFSGVKNIGCWYVKAVKVFESTFIHFLELPVFLSLLCRNHPKFP